MKKTILTIASAIIVAFAAQAGDKQEISFAQLPAASQKLIENYFDKNDISSISQITDDKKINYEVDFNDGTSIDFDQKGKWSEIESPVKPINHDIIPVAIVEDIKTKYGRNAQVKKIKVNSMGYELDLTNGAELEYDAKFKIKKH